MKNFTGRASINMDVTALVSAVGMEVAEEMFYAFVASCEQSRGVTFETSKGELHTFKVDHMEFDIVPIEEYDEEETEVIETGNEIGSYKQ